MSKEEIREKHLYANGLSVNKGPVGQRIQKATFDAMEQYAKEKSIAFKNWLNEASDKKVDILKKSDEQLYNLFLQSSKQ